MRPVADRDRACDDEVFRQLYPVLRRFAAVVADLDVEPDELVQEALTAFLRVDRSRVRNPAAYLRQAVYHVSVRERARITGQKRAIQELGAVSTRGVLPQYPSTVSAVLDALDPRDRALLFLVDIERLPVRDAAAVLGITPVAARARASRARRATHRRLQEEERSDEAPRRR